MNYAEIGKNIVEDLVDKLDYDDFLEWFDEDDLYSRNESAFKDEGAEWLCNICNDVIVSSDQSLDDYDGLAKMEDHIVDEHMEELIEKALYEYFKGKKKTTGVDGRLF
jgi:hypothetical protein